MGYKVIWTDEAIADLHALVTFISQDNPEAAVRFGEVVVSKSFILAEHPRLGKRLRHSDRETLRELSAPPYRVIYEIRDADGGSILIRMVRHGARQEPEIQ